MRLIDAEHLKKWILQRWGKAYPNEDLPTIEILDQIDRETSFKYVDIGLPSQLTDDDKEIIRIHLSAVKERLCNQRRWNEAREYEELISRLLSTPSTQTRKE